jgi:ADP-ribose pyrophosphatase YjhB (NUDIX family)
MPFIRYCFNCGSSVSDHGPGTHPHCTNCGETTWRNSKPTASVLLTDARDRVLLVRRNIEPKTGWWDIPGGFCEPGELPTIGARTFKLKSILSSIRRSRLPEIPTVFREVKTKPLEISRGI